MSDTSEQFDKQVKEGTEDLQKTCGTVSDAAQEEKL